MIIIEQIIGEIIGVIIEIIKIIIAVFPVYGFVWLLYGAIRGRR